VLEGRGWYEMNVHLDRGTPFVKVQINFSNPLTARTPYVLRVFLAKLGTSSVTFRVSVDQDDRSCFVADLTSVVVVTSEMEKIDANDWLKRALEETLSEIGANVE